MKTLAEHGVAWRFNGIPIWDDREDWYPEEPPVGVVSESVWREADLTPEHWNELAEWFADDRSQMDERPHMAAYFDDATLLYSLMDRNGIEHEHLRGKLLKEHRPAFGYECAMCKGYIIAKDPGDFPFYGGPLHGQWVVTDGRKSVLIPIMPEIPVSYSPEDLPDVTVKVATYVRDGDRYVLAGENSATS